MRNSPLALLCSMIGCAELVSISARNPIQPLLLPGTSRAAPLNPAEQAGQTLQQSLRQDQRRDRLNAINPNRPRDFGNPSAQGGTNPFSSNMGDAQFPGTPPRLPRFFGASEVAGHVHRKLEAV